MGMFAGLLGSLSIDGWLCACVRNTVGGGLIKECCVVDVRFFNQANAPLPWEMKKKKNV